jgi:hypothetical protein
MVDLIQLQENTPPTAGFWHTVRHSIQPSLTHNETYGPALLKNHGTMSSAIPGCTQPHKAILSHRQLPK